MLFKIAGMKLFILSDANSVHTQRWVTSLAERGNKIFLFSLSNFNQNNYIHYPSVIVYSCGINYRDGLWHKITYLSILSEIRKKIKEFKPDIVHAHYASSYGLLGALSGFHPYVVSIWGSDVYDFPNKNWLTKRILKYVLKKTDSILSTSNVMSKETGKYTDKPIMITPFGVDLKRFKLLSHPQGDKIVIGNVKTLAPQYGIDVLIKAFKRVVDKNTTKNIVLEIYGDGPCRKEYQHLSEELGISDKVTFRGFVDNTKLPEVYNGFLVSVSVSNRESFGVVAVEAMACECPVITSDADGFTEVVKDGETGFIVPKRDVEATANAIQHFIDCPELREKMGKKGRERVLELYDWNKNVGTMVGIYNNVINEYSSH